MQLQVRAHLQNAGATLLTGVGFFDSSYWWCHWFGDVGRELPWEPQRCLWKTHTHTRMNTAADTDVQTSTSLSLHHVNTLFAFTGLCQCSLFAFPRSSSPAQHPRDALREIGFHTLVIITSRKNVIAIWIYLRRHSSKQEGWGRTDAFRDVLFTI